MNKEDFLPIERAPQEELTSFIKRPSKWERFKVNRLAVVGASIILVMLVLAILGPLNFAIYLCGSILNRCEPKSKLESLVWY